MFKWVYYASGYFVPALIVIISVLISELTDTTAYGYGIDVNAKEDKEKSCWLYGDLIWAFAGPVAAVLAANFIVSSLQNGELAKSR